MTRKLVARIRPRAWALAAVGLALAGCGDGVERYRVQGTVTFDGKPVETGAVFFEPTASVGKIAPTVYLKVQGGRFDTGGDGPAAGKYRVVVGGWDNTKTRVDDDKITHTAHLFDDYKFEVDIPPPNDTLDITVPASQAIKKR
jgi:hypothetical protein